MINYAARLKLDGIEIWSGHIDRYLSEHDGDIASLKNILHEKGLKCPAIAPYFNFIDEKNALHIWVETCAGGGAEPKGLLCIL